ncbi:Hexapeptide repeat of succinyl-transferase [Noviherbaspirillum humi]|uniref:Hexapeptide repeat of succinyl-transferase n=1 Tax=Noviherbaspirillum humi TaxID=1688639 RepID=A0A239C2K2_9BURK|nr:acyltransferase [Noviherbaspirillum humi]SNS14525.1 Hexapeptide repeat of succinyl-transferase [Noviherbaspirillum humi]
MRLRFAHLSLLRRLLVEAKRQCYVRLFGMDLHPSCEFSLSTRFDKTNPRGVHVGAHSYLAFDAALLTHDLTRGVRLHTRVGRNCFIGARSILLPGVQIGDGAIVGAGSVVTRDVPPGCVVAGNPARILRRGIEVGRYGRMRDADRVQARHVAEHGLD